MLNVFPVLLISFVMAAVIYFIGKILPKDLSRLIQLLIQVITGMVIYSGLMWIFKVKSFENIIKLINEQTKFKHPGN